MREIENNYIIHINQLVKQKLIELDIDSCIIDDENYVPSLEIAQLVSDIICNYYNHLEFEYYKNKSVQYDVNNESYIIKNVCSISIPLNIFYDKCLILSAQSDNQDSLDFLVKNNMRYIVKIANQCSSKYRVFSEDLVQVGIIGLINAINKYEIDKNNKLITYATSAISLEMYLYSINNEKNVRIPAYLTKKFNNATNQIAKISNDRGYNLNDHEIIELGILNKKELESYRLYNSGNFLSIDEKINDNDENTVISLIESEENEVDNIIDRYNVEKILKIIEETESLSKRNIEIYKIYNGLGIYNGYEATLEKISQIYGLSSERIRQIVTAVNDRIKPKVRNFKNN